MLFIVIVFLFGLVVASVIAKMIRQSLDKRKSNEAPKRTGWKKVFEKAGLIVKWTLAFAVLFMILWATVQFLCLLFEWDFCILASDRAARLQ